MSRYVAADQICVSKQIVRRQIAILFGDFLLQFLAKLDDLDLLVGRNADRGCAAEHG